MESRLCSSSDPVPATGIARRILHSTAVPANQSKYQPFCDIVLWCSTSSTSHHRVNMENDLHQLLNFVYITPVSGASTGRYAMSYIRSHRWIYRAPTSRSAKNNVLQPLPSKPRTPSVPKALLLNQSSFIPKPTRKNHLADTNNQDTRLICSLPSLRHQGGPLL